MSDDEYTQHEFVSTEFLPLHLHTHMGLSVCKLQEGLGRTHNSPSPVRREQADKRKPTSSCLLGNESRPLHTTHLLSTVPAS